MPATAGKAHSSGRRTAPSPAVSVISAGNGQLNPALASRFNVNRTVDGATSAGNLVEPDLGGPHEALRAPGASLSSLVASAPPCKAKGADPNRASRGAA